MPLSALAGLLALPFIWFAIRRWVAGAAARPRLIEVVGRLALDARKQLYVVKAAGDYMLLAGCDSGIQLIKVLDEDAVREFTSVPAQQAERTPRDFIRHLIRHGNSAARDSAPAR